MAHRGRHAFSRNQSRVFHRRLDHAYLFPALELVSDRARESPFPAARRLWARVKELAMDEGLLCYPGGGTADGINGDHVLLAPPYIVSETQIGELVDKLARAIGWALTTARSPTRTNYPNRLRPFTTQR